MIEPVIDGYRMSAPTQGIESDLAYVGESVERLKDVLQGIRNLREQQRLQIQNVLERLYEHDFLAPLEGD